MATNRICWWSGGKREVENYFAAQWSWDENFQSFSSQKTNFLVNATIEWKILRLWEDFSEFSLSFSTFLRIKNRKFWKVFLIFVAKILAINLKRFFNFSLNFSPRRSFVAIQFKNCDHHRHDISSFDSLTSSKLHFLSSHDIFLFSFKIFSKKI